MSDTITASTRLLADAYHAAWRLCNGYTLHTPEDIADFETLRDAIKDRPILFTETATVTFAGDSLPTIVRNMRRQSFYRTQES